MIILQGEGGHALKTLTMTILKTIHMPEIERLVLGHLVSYPGSLVKVRQY